MLCTYGDDYRPLMAFDYRPCMISLPCMESIALRCAEYILGADQA